MITVRFPNGQAVQYNAASYLTYAMSAWELYESKGGPWVASIMPSAGAIVECRSPCDVRDDAKPRTITTVRYERKEVVRTRLPRTFSEVIDVIARGGKPKPKGKARKA